uniref:Apple domain-containing protein n=2 Tax=Parascaris TaxID=6254 RepID=A0A915ATP6_PARUN
MVNNRQQLTIILQFVAVLSCATLPLFQAYGGHTFYLHKMTECKGGKVFEVQNVQDYDQCRAACMEYNCAAVNVFQLGEFQFVCEILEDIEGMIPATGAACYAPF